MSTADVPADDPLETWSFHPGEHPDLAWAESLRAALDDWLRGSWPTAPTSSLTGGGAIAAFEATFRTAVGAAHALMVPSATAGLRLALEGVGAGPGTEVLVPVLDWPATYAAVSSLGAVPVPVDVDPSTLTMDVAAAATARTRRTLAAVVCHLHGIPADVPALEQALGLPIVEDCAGAAGSLLDARPVGTMGAVGVFSLGPGKRLDAGEGGVVVTADPALYERMLARAAHPLRLLRSGLDPELASPDALVQRPHPVAALLGLHRLASWCPEDERVAHAALARAATAKGLQVLGCDARRRSAAGQVPVLLPTSGAREIGVASGARVLPHPLRGDSSVRAGGLLSRTRLLPVDL